MEEGLATGRLQHLLAVPHSATQNATQDITAALVRRHGTVSDSERERAGVVCEHTAVRTGKAKHGITAVSVMTNAKMYVHTFARKRQHKPQ